MHASLAKYFVWSFFVFFFFTLPVKAANAPVKEWTMLVYLNGDNSLDPFASTNLLEMEKVGSSQQINVVVQWASLRANNVKRFLVKKSTDPNRVTSPILQSMGPVDMGNYHSLVDFVKWGVENYPAKHYFITVWNHGGGWHLDSFDPTQAGLDNSMQTNDISWDDLSGHFITIPQLGLAMAESAKIIGHKVDLYASDACLMAMPEVAFEMADSVQYFAGSEETEPGAGWPYDTFLAEWEQNPELGGDDVAQILAKSYQESFLGGSHGNRPVTFSSFDLSKIGGLIDALKDFGTALRSITNPSVKTGIHKAMLATLRFDYEDFGDLHTFTENLKKFAPGSVPDSILNSVTDAAQAFVLTNAVNSLYLPAEGVSVWLPYLPDQFDSPWHGPCSHDQETYWQKYQTMKFESATDWGASLRTLLPASKPKPPAECDYPSFGKILP